MAISKCAKCDNTHFEAVEANPALYKFKVTFIQCSNCGTVVGVLEYLNISATLDVIARKLGIDVSSPQIPPIPHS